MPLKESYHPFSPSSEDHHTVYPTAAHTHTIILLHGRGSTGPEFAGEFFESQDSHDRFFPAIYPGMKWVFPTAATRWAETDQKDMSQWFDMASVRYPQQEVNKQLAGLRESLSQILRVVTKEAQEVPMNRIFLGGISQGCATAVYAVLCGLERMAGFIGISGWLPDQEAVVRLAETGKRREDMIDLLDIMDTDTALLTPVLLEHNEDDDVVPIVNGEGLRDGLSKWGVRVEMKRYGSGGHWVNEPQGVDDMVRFMDMCL